MDMIGRKKILMHNQPQIFTSTGGIASFDTNMSAPLKSCKVEFTPIQEGTGDPSPENVRPITGWTGLTVYKTGKSLWTPERPVDVSGTYHGWKMPTGVKIQAVVDVIDSTVVAKTYFGTTGNGHDAKNNVSWWWSNATPKGMVYNAKDSLGYVSLYPLVEQTLASYANCMVVLYGADTTYEPYTGTTIPIDWTTEAGTVYGGYVNLITGEIWKEWGKLQPTTSNTTVRTSTTFQYSYFMRTELNGWSNSRFDLISNVLAQRHTNIEIQSALSGWQKPGSSAVIYWVHPDCATEQGAESLRTSTAVEFYYKLKTPVLVATLSATQIKSFKGTNNIWSNTNGDTTVEYWKR